MDATPVAGLFLGLAGSGHCVAMCGGVASALDRISPETGWGRVLSHALYGVGRVGSYALVGGLVGGVGFAVSHVVGPDTLPGVQLAARVVLGLLLILVSIGLAGVRAPRGLERVGHAAWRTLQPLARPLSRLPGPLKTLGLGALWGFIPCGMVYSASAVAAVTGSVSQGALFMAAFGIGTMPAVFATGAFATGLWNGIGRQKLQRLSAFAVALCGVWIIVGPMLMTQSQHVAHH